MAFESSEIIGPSFYMVSVLLCVILVLNLYWFRIIAKNLFAILWAGVEIHETVSDTETDGTAFDSDSSYLSDSYDTKQDTIKRHED